MSHNATGDAPPEMRVFHNRPRAPKPIHSLSEDQNGEDASSEPSTFFTSNESRRRRKSEVDPPRVATKQSVDPSGESAKFRESNDSANRMSSGGE